ncbi:MAG: FAD-binding oxidoreductase [Nakamurella sp.]
MTGTLTTDLRDRLRGRVWEPADDGYDGARRVWNGAVDPHPAVVASCLDSDDVRNALLLAREHEIPLSVRGGGHDWAGRAVRDGGLVLDLSGLGGVRIDPVAAVAHAQGGALISDIVDPAAALGLGTATGVVRTVGMAGMTMAGGYGGLIGRFGLALDNLLSADVVLADGRLVTASPESESELFWALRGGGGNFGVLTAARYRLHPLGLVHGGMVLYPFEQAVAVLRGYREVVTTAPDELTVAAGFVTGPTGGPAVFLSPTWSGDPALGDAAVAPLSQLGTPLFSGVRPTPYPELLRLFDAGMANVDRFALGTQWLPELTDDVIAALADGAVRKPSPFSLLMLHQFHGAAARVAQDATAFALRRDHLLAEVIAAWPGSAGDDPETAAGPQRRWVNDVTTALAPYALPGGYPNILGPEDAERTKLGYGGNADRLLSAKRRYDPDGVFTAIGAIGG